MRSIHIKIYTTFCHELSTLVSQSKKVKNYSQYLMCGILLCYGPSFKAENDRLLEFYEDEVPRLGYDDNIESMVKLVRCRGPNYCSMRQIKDVNSIWIFSVLSLRQPFTKQSIVIGNKYVLQFNGELYNDEIIESGNDTQFLSGLLKKCISEDDIFNILHGLDGEFAFTIQDLENNLIYFGRDTIGKRSLSYSLNYNISELIVTSVSGSDNGSRIFNDCVAGVIYKYDIDRNILDTTSTLRKPWSITREHDDDMTHIDTCTKNLYDLLSGATRKRVESIHPLHIENSPISILFSGGLDCSVITALVCETLISRNMHDHATIELLNVAFENLRTGMMPQDAPDRQLAVKSYSELCEKYPNINIKLIEVDVSYAEYMKHRPEVVDLMYPKNTEMDLSIAIAFYFASRGDGFITDDNGVRKEYKRKGLVLFSGLGADELYGGYYKLSNKLEDELANELTTQINNIYRRNLNRDDKVIASNGVEVRYPFLAEEVVEFSTASIPLNYKRDKMILRNIASSILGLHGLSAEKKRAIQFGAKSAKMTKNGNKNGTDLL